jgi:DNA-directed RNA polymerase specialized sigma24 family protein
VNETEWMAVLEDCYAQVLRALIGACGSREQAEDGLQDALAAAWKPGVREGIERPDAWLYRVGLRRIGRTRWRRRREVAIDPEWVGAHSPTLDRVFALDLLKKLSRRQRELVIARYFLGLSYAEIGSHWGINPGTASATVSHALARLRNDLQREESAWTSKSV